MVQLHRRLIAFDLDGTLIDSRKDLADSANALILERGGAPLSEDAIGRMVGEGAATLVRRALTAASLPIDDRSVPRFLELYDQRLLAHTKPYDGMPEALAALADAATLAVVTNKPLQPTLGILEGLELARFFDEVIGGDGPFPRKPDPASLTHLVGRYASSPRDALLIGDSRIDFETAQAAGTMICLARYGYGYEGFPVERLSGREAAVDSPSELPAAIERLFA